MKDLFFGALGRTDNHGGSKMFSTPHTINITPEYTINTNINRNFVTCSLDGRLWAFGSGTTYVLFAFNWNVQTSQLEQSAYLNFRGERIIARGLDWVLTPRTLIFVSDETPYINTANLFDGTGRFLFSILRSSATTAAWGLGENGNSEGWGFFNKNNIAGFQQCYSFLPSVGDWYITPNFLLKKNYSSSYNSMRLLRPLIPLEFNGTNTPFYGMGYNTGSIQLVHRGNAIYGRGANNIGRVFLLPAVFDEDGEPIEFYLYISPDYVFSRSNDNDWPDMPIIASQNGSFYGFASEQIDTLNNALCHSSEKFFDVANDEWQDYEGSIFFDLLHSSAVGIQDEGLTLFHDSVVDLQCEALPQWVAPSETLDCITDNLVISSTDDLMFAANISGLFHRNTLDKKTLPLSSVTYGDGNKHVRVSLGLTSGSRKNIAVNHFASNELQPSIAWENIYKQAVNIRLLNTWEQSLSNVIYINGYPVISSGLLYNISRPVDQYNEIQLDNYDSTIYTYGNKSDGTIAWPDIVHNAFVDLSFIDPDTGEIETRHLSINYENVIPEAGEDDWYSEFPNYYMFWPTGQKLYRPVRVDFQNGMFGIVSCYYESNDYNIIRSDNYFTPLISIESIIPSTWQSGTGSGLSLNSLILPNGSLNSLPTGCASAAYAVFSENNTNTKFALHLPSLLSVDTEGNKTGFFQNADNFTFSQIQGYNFTLHFVTGGNKTAVLRSEAFSNIFNFYDELQRSRLS